MSFELEKKRIIGYNNVKYIEVYWRNLNVFQGVFKPFILALKSEAGGGYCGIFH